MEMTIEERTMSGPSQEQSPPDSSLDEALEEGFILVRVPGVDSEWRGPVLLRRTAGAMLIVQHGLGLLHSSTFGAISCRKSGEFSF